jgi:hypothetical protein
MSRGTTRGYLDAVRCDPAVCSAAINMLHEWCKPTVAQNKCASLKIDKVVIVWACQNIRTSSSCSSSSGSLWKKRST